jgi:hypothetical protein
MTGPEHYRQAEKLIATARQAISPTSPASGFHARVPQMPGAATPSDTDRYTRAITEAQVHAILALAAATALDSDTPCWAEVAGTKLSGSP